MGKTKSVVQDTITVHYDLFDLPTAQHKAGLAGLILQIRSLEDLVKKDPRLKGTPVPKIQGLTATTATIEFSEESVQTLFDEVYLASIEEVAVKAKWQGQTPKREEEVEDKDDEGKVKRSKRFIYDVTQPTGRFLKSQIRNNPDQWMKLWRDMLWSIPRGIPKTRIPFEQRAAGDSCKEGADAWQDLLRVQQARNKNSFFTAPVAGSLWLGAQSTNAELIPFQGRAEHSLLLHFWTLTALIYVPQQIDQDGESEFVGYVLAIPEVSDLEQFPEDYRGMLSELSKENRGYRPAEAVIDLPAEGALSFLEHLAHLASQKGDEALKYSVSSVEYLHLVKIGNNVKSMAAGRIAPRPGLLKTYLEIAGRPGRPPLYRNSLFRRCLLQALLQSSGQSETDWFIPFARLFSQYPWPFFVRSAQSPNRLPWFWQDAATKFDGLFNEHHQLREALKSMTADSPPPTPQMSLDLLIFRLVSQYIRMKTDQKSPDKWDDVKDRKTPDGKPDAALQNYREVKERIASNIFLEMRSRREQEFINHFTGTFCSVKQFLSQDQYATVADALMNRHEDVKTLTLLALSANS